MESRGFPHQHSYIVTCLILNHIISPLRWILYLFWLAASVQDRNKERFSPSLSTYGLTGDAGDSNWDTPRTKRSLDQCQIKTRWGSRHKHLVVVVGWLEKAANGVQCCFPCLSPCLHNNTEEKRRHFDGANGLLLQTNPPLLLCTPNQSWWNG